MQTVVQLLQNTKRGKQMAYNSKTAKPVYYKQPVKTFTQLQKNIIRLQYDTRMDGTTKEKYITLMFESYKDNTFVE